MQLALSGLSAMGEELEKATMLAAGAMFGPGGPAEAARQAFVTGGGLPVLVGLLRSGILHTTDLALGVFAGLGHQVNKPGLCDAVAKAGTAPALAALVNGMPGSLSGMRLQACGSMLPWRLQAAAAARGEGAAA